MRENSTCRIVPYPLIDGHSGAAAAHVLTSQAPPRDPEGRNSRRVKRHGLFLQLTGCFFILDYAARFTARIDGNLVSPGLAVNGPSSHFFVVSQNFWSDAASLGSKI